MKILVAYDGSADCHAAIDDLPRAGLPRECEVTVLTVADILMLPSHPPAEGAEFQVQLWTMAHEEAQLAANAQATALAEAGAGLLRSRFPNWRVRSESREDSPAWGVIRKSDEWRPDLIVCGAQGKASFLERLLGSVSQRVLYEAHCGVRIGRRTPTASGSRGPVRLLLGWDASADALAAVERIANGAWPEDSRIRFVTAYDHNAPVSLESEPFHDPHVAHRLLKVGLTFEMVFRQGTPKHVLLAEAKSWNAHAIFLGAQGFASTIGRLNLLNKIERAWAGSTAAAVAALAPCSVEITRSRP